MEEIKVMVKLIGGKPYEECLGRPLVDQVGLVSGYSECLALVEGIELWLHKNAEKQSYNFTIYRMDSNCKPYPVVRINGNVYFASRDSAGEITDLTKKQLQKVLQMFYFNEDILLLGR
ncbi:hypothetical protein [Peribacillus muralis]|uniref:hypothetical protein n=1 Tax=Peribacillus muralis TaxID=264697 RepID=UPI00366DFD9D